MIIADLLPGAPWVFLLAVLGFCHVEKVEHGDNQPTKQTTA